MIKELTILAVFVLIFAYSPAFAEEGGHKGHGHHAQEGGHAAAEKQGGMCPDELKGVGKAVKTLENGVELVMTAKDAEGAAEVQKTAAAHYAEEGRPCKCLPKGAAVKLESIETGVKVVITGDNPKLIKEIQAKYVKAHDCSCCKSKTGKPASRKIAAEEIGKESVCPVTGEKFKVAAETASVSYKGRVYYFCCPGCKKPFLENPEKYLQKKQQPEAKVYVCPMGDYQGDKPGKCPKCGMTLEEKRSPQAKTYVCPMGCAESYKPGKCPKCGMDLMEKK